MKFVETCGRKYSDFLKSSNPFRAKCGENEKCFVCSTTQEGGHCRTSNINYSITCKLCNKQYIGESSRSGYLRGVEHLRALEKKSKHSVLYRHIASDHREEEEKVDFKMQVTG